MRRLTGGRPRAARAWRDLVVDRSALDRVIQAGYISVNCGSAPEANAIPVPKASADQGSPRPRASAGASGLACAAW
jgi:hypothetical protein